MRLPYLLLLQLIGLSCFAQPLFERYSKIAYQKALIKSVVADNSYTGIASYKGYKVKLLGTRLKDGINILIYHDNRLVGKFNDDDISPIRINKPLLFADIDGNGLFDFKISLSGTGSGLAASLVRKIYLFRTNDDKFVKISFEDFSDSSEYDLNNDGNYEIVAKAYAVYQNHAYWIFNLYNFNNGKLKNVDKQYDYPIMVKYLYKTNYQTTNKVPRAEIKKFSMVFPQSTPK